MATMLLSALAFLLAVACSSGTPVKIPTIEDRVQKLEGATELEYEFSHDLDKRVAVLERFIASLLSGNTSEKTLPDVTEMTSLQEKISQQLTQAGNDTLPLFNLASRAVPGAQVAFHAYIANNRILSPNEVVVFDQATANVGNGYTASDGLFDAPYSGTYVFTWTISTGTYHSPITTHLIVGGDIQGILTSASDYEPGTQVGQGSHPATAVVVTYVQAGQHVFIRNKSPLGASANMESDVMIRSTFSGWLLF